MRLLHRAAASLANFWVIFAGTAAALPLAMLIKIDRGTPLQAEGNLCETCSHGRITRGRRLEEEIIFCRAGAMTTVRITFRVTSCTDYTDNREPSYFELAQKAWILRPATRRRAAGFVRVSELEDEEVGRLLMDPTP